LDNLNALNTQRPQVLERSNFAGSDQIPRKNNVLWPNNKISTRQSCRNKGIKPCDVQETEASMGLSSSFAALI